MNLMSLSSLLVFGHIPEICKARSSPNQVTKLTPIEKYDSKEFKYFKSILGLSWSMMPLMIDTSRFGRCLTI